MLRREKQKEFVIIVCLVDTEKIEKKKTREKPIAHAKLILIF